MKPIAARGLLAAVLAASTLDASAALDVAGLDRSLDACTNFYEFANRSWMAATPIPEDRARWGTMQIVDQNNEKALLETIKKEMRIKTSRYKAKSPERMALQYFQSGMNDNRIDYWSESVLLPYLKAAAAANDPAAIARQLGELHAKGIGGGFAFGVDPDRKDSTRYLAEISQGGLGLPERDYYFRDDERTRAQREAYVKHVAKMLELIGDAPEVAGRNAAAVLAFETELARASMTAVERRDVDKTYNKMAVAQLAAEAPGFPWKAYFDALGAKGLAELNVSQPAFFKALARLATERATDWPTYLRWHIVHSGATKLPPRFEDEHFDFYERQLQGVQVPPPRARRVLRIIGGPFGEQGLGMAIGKIFTDAHFPPEAKARALELVKNVKAALRDRLAAVTWMTEETRRLSLEKLDTMQVKIGYPDKWRDYTGADIGRGNFLENWLASNAFDHQRDLKRIGQKVDRGEWLASPHIVNAYYNQSANEIVFLAGILQPPFFDAKADDALNYGGIGMVIGHEITHGFDDRGRRFDKDGNLRDWWTAEDERRYKERAQLIERQYASFEGIDGVKPNGTLTLGENISDIGGIKIAFDALQKSLKGKPRAKIDGLTPEQRFFLSYAQVWRNTARTEWERNALLTGQHSLPRYRVAGPIAHMPEFAKAFSCDASKTLLPGIERNAIW